MAKIPCKTCGAPFQPVSFITLKRKLCPACWTAVKLKKRGLDDSGGTK